MAVVATFGAFAQSANNRLAFTSWEPIRGTANFGLHMGVQLIDFDENIFTASNIWGVLARGVYQVSGNTVVFFNSLGIPIETGTLNRGRLVIGSRPVYEFRRI